ncbi:MAG: hypothetical protein OXI09_09205 [Chloroflexota bacterium]|nr:hypothetical protein [Chloroflexota bacterium]
MTGHSLKWPWQQRVTIKDDEPPPPPKTGPLAEVDASIPNWKREEWYDPWKRYHGRGTFTVPEGSPTTYRITLSERVTRENPLTLKYSVWQDGDVADSKYIGSHAVTLRWSPTPREQKRSEVPSDYTPPPTSTRTSMVSRVSTGTGTTWRSRSRRLTTMWTRPSSAR